MSGGITHRCTDLRNAERLVELFGEDLRYVELVVRDGDG